MIDRKTEAAIRAVKSFLEFWDKFHAIYGEISAKGLISQDDEQKFLETKEMMSKIYGELAGVLDFRYSPHGRLTDPVGDILALESVRLISEKNLKRANDDWRDSYVFLNNILERLKSKKRRLGQFNPVGVFFKKLLKKRAAQPEVMR